MAALVSLVMLVAMIMAASGFSSRWWSRRSLVRAALPRYTCAHCGAPAEIAGEPLTSLSSSGRVTLRCMRCAAGCLYLDRIPSSAPRHH